jgi:tetratricopeptide (TPR) repeat protein
MVLPAPPAHTPPVEPHWFDDVVLAIELSAHGILTLVDHAAPSRLREAFLRLRARDAATDLIVDVQRLATLPPGATVILAMAPSITTDALDWLNLNRPVIADRRLNLVLWCEGDAAAILARRAPDFFDWISARVDCPPAPAAFAVADVKAAIRARAPGIAWAGPGLEETLAAVRPGRPIRRVAVSSYQSMIDALTSREPGWLFLEGIETEFHLRRLRWAIAETGRRVIVLRPAIAWTYPGWWTVQAEHAPIADAVHDVITAGGTGRLAALAGLDPTACASVAFLLRQGSDLARLDSILVAAVNPRDALENLAGPLGWTRSNVVTEKPPAWMSKAMRYAFVTEAERHRSDDGWVVSALREEPRDARRWQALGENALAFGDSETAIRWLNAALHAISDDSDPRLTTFVHVKRGQAYRDAGDLTVARSALERAHSSAIDAADSSSIVLSAGLLAATLLDLGETRLAREHLESALRLGDELDTTKRAFLLEGLAAALAVSPTTPKNLSKAKQHLEQALAIRRSALTTDEHPSIAASLRLLGTILLAQGDLTEARRHLQRSLEISERFLGPEHPDRATTLAALARVQQETGDLAGARAYLVRALAVQEVTLGVEHPEIANTLIALSDVLAVNGELDRAQATLERALSIQQNALGGDGQLAGATTRRELAKVLAAKGDLTGAIQNLEQALPTQRRILERDDHPDIAATQRELDRLQALQRDVQRPD